MGNCLLGAIIFFVSLNKDKELEGGQNLCFCFACMWGGGGGGGFENFTCLKRGGGQRKNIITVEFLLSLPLYNKKCADPYIIICVQSLELMKCIQS